MGLWCSIKVHYQTREILAEDTNLPLTPVLLTFKLSIKQKYTCPSKSNINKAVHSHIHMQTYRKTKQTSSHPHTATRMHTKKYSLQLSVHHDEINEHVDRQHRMWYGDRFPLHSVYLCLCVCNVNLTLNLNTQSTMGNCIF